MPGRSKPLMLAASIICSSGAGPVLFAATDAMAAAEIKLFGKWSFEDIEVAPRRHPLEAPPLSTITGLVDPHTPLTSAAANENEEVAHARPGLAVRLALPAV